MKKKKLVKIIERLIEERLRGNEPDSHCGGGPEETEDVSLFAPDVDASLFYPAAIKSPGAMMRTRGKYKDGFPVGAVVHSTDGRPNDGKDSAAAALKENLYAYFVIGRAGAVFQYFPLDSWGHHAGVTAHPVLEKNLSEKLVGIEIVSAGKLKKIDDNRFRPWYNEKNPKLKDDFTSAEVNYRDEVGKPNEFGYQKAGHYHKFTQEQETALLDLLNWLKQTNPSVFKYANVVGHDEIAVDDDYKTHGRKSDPGGSLSITVAQLRAKLGPD
jgi:N-acetyl-anhydromuramyl-L-alanine amidase AmpD